MPKISIIGFGRFGPVLYRLLKDDFEITVYDKDAPESLPAGAHVAGDLQAVYASDVIFYAVPIEAFEEVIASHQKYFEPRHLLIDVLSVKMHAAAVFQKYLPKTGARAILTHPLFGPDSVGESFANLTLVMDKFTADEETFDYWKKLFAKKGLNVVEMLPEEHDRMAANSQGLTHFIGRLLDEYGFEPSPIDTAGAKKLLEVKEQVRHDTWQLFTNLQHYNPFTKDMRIRLGDVYDSLYNRLLPKQAHADFITYGIQGGPGSFNEEAIRDYLSRAEPHAHEIKYLYTSERVLRALHAGEIDKGQFAIHNSVGGIVGESLHAIAAHKFKIVEEFAIKISHALMIRDDADVSEIDTVVSHPQVFAQCKDTLRVKYPRLKLVSGEGDRIDHALVAKDLAEGKLPKSTATMGSRILSNMYGLKIVEDNLQDAQENYTSFIIAARPNH